MPLVGDNVTASDNPKGLRVFGIPHFADHETFFPLKGYVLIAALLLAPGKSLGRQAAACLLWENADQKRALANLRQLLLRLHQFSGEAALVVASGTSLSAGPVAFRSDLSRFLEAIAARDVETRLQAILEFRGDLLTGCEGEEQLHLWLLSERARLKGVFFSSMASLLDDMTRFGGQKSGEIAALADCAFAVEPDREETYRLFMLAYSRQGDQPGFERVSENLTRMLRNEARSPEPATLALKRRIRADFVDYEPEPVSKPRPEKPRVAFALPSGFDRAPAPELVQSFVEDVAYSLVRYRTFTILAPQSTYVVTSPDGNKPLSALRPDYVVRTTVFNDLRASVSLIAEQSGEIVWSLELSLDQFDMPAAARMLSRQVAAGLAENLEQRQLASSRKHDASAYFHLLSGQQLLRGKCDLPILRRARSEFRKAMELDPGMAVARGRIAQTLQLEWLMLGGTDPHLLYRAKAEAEASVAIDPASGIGQWMGAVIALHQRDFDASAEQFLEAEALAPNSADLLLQHADALAHFGQNDPAWERFQRALDLNPFAPDIYWWAGASIALKREDYTTAVELCSRMENDEPALRVLTVSHALSGDLVTARQYGRRLKENHPGMTARQISLLSPDRNPEVNEKLFHAYQLAGIK